MRYTDSTIRYTNHTTSLGTNENIVDGNMDQLHEIADQSHHDETDSSSRGGLGELYRLRRIRNANPSCWASCNGSGGTCCL